MGTVDPTRERFERFARSASSGPPLVMLNLLRFRERAEYEGGGPGGTGRDAYARYGRAVVPLLWEVGGQVLWSGKVRFDLIAPEGESWDEAILVYYPSRQAFLRMVQSEAYQAIMPHRTAALSDSRLLETEPNRLPRWVLGAGRALIRLKSLALPKVR